MFELYHHAIAKLEKATINPMDYMRSGADPRDQQFFLDRGQYFFDRIGNPENGPKIIHVAGTSGKGSTVTMLYEILRADGKNVGLYMSPYVTAAIENIQANGTLIDPNDFARLTEKVLPVVEQIRTETPDRVPSYAEVFFGIAMLYFQEIGIEWLVLEVGCGGRFDKTNIVPTPVAVGLTPIGFDHTDLLGDTLESIAWHKAGILKDGVQLVVSNETKPDVRAVFDAEAADHKLTVTYVAANPGEPFATRMPGAHQQHNAALAAEICRRLGIAEDTIAMGIARAQLPARTEMMQQQPRVLLDGAHSEPKMTALIDVLNAMQAENPWDKLIVVFAAKEGKDTQALVTPLAQRADSVILSSFTLPGFSSYPPQHMRDIWTQAAPHSEPIIEANPLKAVETALQLAGPNDLVVITGSLYLAGAARQYWISEEAVLKTRSAFPQNNG